MGAIPSPMAGYNDMSDTILSNGKANKKILQVIGRYIQALMPYH